MTGIWTCLVPRSRQHVFFGQSVLGWLFSNLGSDAYAFGASWPTLFAVSVWWSWKWRCGNVFGVNGKCRDRVQFLKTLATEVTKAWEACREANAKPSRVERMISWTPPAEGWMKINTDGAFRGNPGLATARGVLRDQYGAWCGGFALNIGICTAPLAELWGVYYELLTAWEKRVVRLEVEVDSELVVGFLKTGICTSHPLSFLVRLCHGFIARDWIVRISHAYREANRLADGLANYTFTVSLGFHCFSSVPPSLDSILQDDILGYECPCSICIT
ncbi:unnamed protein product [Microthlaspi erraticum]|uniref:RNase H type-1 domain-containing protein n=1 Tax=Microthlaspi erraticum TaxID=1685480 RepID=A0A6D2JRP8_9BRAS|nr:unnamed protein product [Microthlaspi erraticum]